MERCETEARALNKLGYEFTSTHTHTHTQGTCTWRNARRADDIMSKECAPKGAPWPEQRGAAWRAVSAHADVDEASASTSAVPASATAGHC